MAFPSQDYAAFRRVIPRLSLDEMVEHKEEELRQTMDAEYEKQRDEILDRWEQSKRDT